MPRRQFIADLQKAQSDILPPGVLNLRPGEDDGQFEFLFSSSPLTTDSVKVTAMVPDLGEYPRSHEYMIFSGEQAPPHIAEALQSLRRTSGKTVSELLDIISTTLSRLADQDGDDPMPDSQLEDDEDLQDDLSDEDDDVYDSDHEAFQTDEQRSRTFGEQPSGSDGRPIDRAFRARVRSDLKMAKAAGFKVGVLGPILDGHNAFVCIAIRIGKLGISEEAMEAWQVNASDYIILLIQYPNGYKTNEELQGYDSLRLQPNIGMRVVAGKKYKPTLQEAIKAFTVARRDARGSMGGTDLPNAEDATEESSIKETFISRPLNGLLQERLAVVLRFRSAGMSWRGAEEHYQTQATAGANYVNATPDSYFEPEPVNPALPQIMNADHYSERHLTVWSFPLLAMQFLLRHFVRCTEFCLVCHRPLNTELEAIKPYVCDSELCLYQYMSLGFGPSIEHEILTQPYVVDLLVSFCYKSASTCKLKEYPDGLSLSVPSLNGAIYTTDNLADGAGRYGYMGRQQTTEPIVEITASSQSYEVGFDRDRLELIFFEKPDVCPVKRGDWIALKTTDTLGKMCELHCRVADATYFPTLSINEPLTVHELIGTDNVSSAMLHASNKLTPASVKPASPAQTPKWIPATFQIYCEDFKALNVREKCVSICRLLDTLPDVKSLRDYLLQNPLSDLKSWVARISPAAVSLLRWIIASNRACIVQVDGDGTGTSKQERLKGMRDYMQFRFAMGAPDKEQRFLTEVRNTTDRLNLTTPTIFAWHGSPLHNWHMIIREGLHFKNVDHGRAYGDGVYHALDASTSSGYSGNGMYGFSGKISLNTWRSSMLRISSALALNEIVNAPTEFRSCSPFYVVQQLDWIQTRYLFVQCQPIAEDIHIGTDTEPKNAVQQDPRRIPKGVSGPVVIPASAIKTHRIISNERKADASVKLSPFKKLKTLGGLLNPISVDEDDDDACSVVTHASDVEIVYGIDSDLAPQPVTTQVVVLPPAGPTTDFVPGALDFSKLPLMPTPNYALSNTTKRLMKDLALCKKIQDSTPPAELGWFIDINKIENTYQWILELHSFHMFSTPSKALPLAEDMKKQKVTSVVMEMRFNKDFPFTPPYVRVIRPRFLTRAQGGGGHIVMGGAMCMELLTNSGWSSVSSMESVLLQIRMAIASEPYARLDTRTHGDYGMAEAAEGYIRACQTHGWEVPPGFKEMAYGIDTAGSSRFY